MTPVAPILASTSNQVFTYITINYPGTNVNPQSVLPSNISVTNLVSQTQALVMQAAPMGSSAVYQVYAPNGNWGNSPQGTYFVSVYGSYAGGVNGDGPSVPYVPNIGSFVVDVSAPNAVIVAPGQGNTTTASPINFQVAFTEPVGGFSGGDVTLTGTAGATTATVSPLNSQGTLYNLAVSGMTTNGTVIPTIRAGTVFDLSGNTNFSITGNAEFYYDTTPPTASLASAPNVLATSAGAHTASVTINYGDITGVGVNAATFATSNITVSNGSTNATVTGVSNVGNVVTYTVQSPSATWGASAQGTYVVSLVGGTGGVKDRVGNSVVANPALGSFQVNTVPLTVTINQASSQANLTSAATINFTVAFNKPVSNFTTGDVTLGGTAGATKATVTPAQPGGLLWNVAVSGMQSAGTVIATIAPNVASDAAGNPNTASTSTDNSVTYTPPMTRMFRLYNPNAGLHVYTTSTGEFNALIKLGYTDESPQTTGFLVMTIQLPGTNPVHRVYNPFGGQHYLTLSSAEESALVQAGWLAETDQGYLYPSAQTGTIPVYLLYNSNNGDHLYTVSTSEVSALLTLPTSPNPWSQQANLGYGYAASATAVQSSVQSSVGIFTMDTDVVPARELSVSPAVAPESTFSSATSIDTSLESTGGGDRPCENGELQFAAGTTSSTTLLDQVWKDLGAGLLDSLFQNAA